METENTGSTENRDARTWAFVAHLLGLAFVIIPFIANIVGPLVVLLVKGEQYEFVRDQAKESLNFQISMSVYLLVSGALSFILIGIPVFIGLLIFDVIVIIMATVRANEGLAYRYPLSIRFVS